MESRFDHSAAVTSEGIYIMGSKSGTRGRGAKPQTTYSVELFPSVSKAGAQGGSFNPSWIPGPELPVPLYGQEKFLTID